MSETIRYQYIRKYIHKHKYKCDTNTKICDEIESSWDEIRSMKLDWIGLKSPLFPQICSNISVDDDDDEEDDDGDDDSDGRW